MVGTSQSSDEVFTCTPDPRLSSPSPRCTSLAKIDPDGSVDWVRSVDSSLGSIYNAVAVAPDGGAVVGASGALSSEVIKFTASGDLAWTSTAIGAQSKGEPATLGGMAVGTSTQCSRT